MSVATIEVPLASGTTRAAFDGQTWTHAGGTEDKSFLRLVNRLTPNFGSGYQPDPVYGVAKDAAAYFKGSLVDYQSDQQIDAERIY